MDAIIIFIINHPIIYTASVVLVGFCFALAAFFMAVRGDVWRDDD